jgi:hypothetical protein
MSKSDGWHPIDMRTSPAIRKYLEALVQSGLYGFTIEEAAERIICRHINKMIVNGTLPKIRFWP